MRLSAALDASPRLSLLAKIAASYGKNELIVEPDERAPFDFLTLMLPMVPDLLDLQSELGASYQLDPLLRADTSLTFTAFGGLSHASQRHVPLELGPDLYFGLERSLSPLTSVGGSVDLNSTFGSHDSRSDSLRLEGTLKRRLTRSLALRLSAGANAARTLHRDHLYHRLSPVLEGALEASAPGRFSRWDLLFLGGIGPHTDPFTGEQHDRFEAGALVKLALHERLALRWRVGAARELPSRDEPSASLAIAGADLAYAFRGGFSLGGGVQASLERAPGMSQSTFWTVFTRAAWSLPNAF